MPFIICSRGPREGAAGWKPLCRWTELGSVAEAGVSGRGWGHLRGWRGEVRMLWLKKKKKRIDEMDWRGIAADGCHRLSDSFPAFSCPLRTQITQLSASRCHTSIVCSQRLPESLGCCSLPFYSPLGSNMLQNKNLPSVNTPIQRHDQFKLSFKTSTFLVQSQPQISPPAYIIFLKNVFLKSV